MRARRPSTFRIEGPAGQEITSLDDWLRYAPPKKGERHWRPGRSAMESARAWLDDGHGPTVPAEIAEVLNSHELTRAFRPELAVPELVTRLDDFRGEHRNHDLVVVGEAAGGRTLLAIEAKADESFGDHTVDAYLQLCAKREKEYPAKVDAARRAGKGRPRSSNAAARIEQLCAALFGPALESERVAQVAKPLRYQLVTAFAGALIEARARSCTQAVLLVHEFLSEPNAARAIPGTRSSLVERNAAAFADFARAVTADPSADVRKGHLLGPLAVPGNARVPDLPLLLGKARRNVSWPDSGLVQNWDKVPPPRPRSE